MSNCKTLRNYNAFDIISLVCCLLDNDYEYDIIYNKDNSQIIIERQVKDNKDIDLWLDYWYGTLRTRKDFLLIRHMMKLLRHWKSILIVIIYSHMIIK